MAERYNFFDEMPTDFHVNTDLECAKKYGLNPYEVHLALFVKDSLFRTEPYILTKYRG